MTVSIPIVEMSGIGKRYGGVHALRHAALTVHPREIHAIVGDNAAGKSTLIKILSGAVQADDGLVTVDGRPCHIRSPGHAKELGIETVYQDLALADNLDIASNIFLGRELMYPGLLRNFLDTKRMEREAEQLLSRLKIRIPTVKQPVQNLSGGQRQCVAIARTIYFDARLIVLDEPCAALGVEETRKVLELVREMRDQGLTVLMISHNLRHVFDLCDRITVMKAGQTVGSRRIAETTHDEVLSLIVTGAGALA